MPKSPAKNIPVHYFSINWYCYFLFQICFLRSMWFKVQKLEFLILDFFFIFFEYFLENSHFLPLWNRADKIILLQSTFINFNKYFNQSLALKNLLVHKFRKLSKKMFRALEFCFDKNLSKWHQKDQSSTTIWTTACASPCKTVEILLALLKVRLSETRATKLEK